MRRRIEPAPLAYAGGALAAMLASVAAGYAVVRNPELLHVSVSPRNLAALTAAIAAAAALVRRPGAGIVVLVALVYLNLSELLVRFHGLPSLLQLLAPVLLLAAWVARGPRDVVRALSPGSLATLLVAFLLVLLATTTFARDPALAEERVLEFARATVVALLIVILAWTPALVRRGAWTLLAAGALLGAIGVFQAVTGSYGFDFGGLGRIKYAQIYGNVFRPRIAGPLGDPNFFAQMLVPVVGLAAVVAGHVKSRRQRVAALACAALAAGGVVLSYSRGGALALAVVALLAAFANRIPVRHIALVGVVAVTISLANPNGLVRRLATIGEFLPGGEEVFDPDSSFQERTLLMASAWHMFLDHPVAGVGAGNYSAHYGDYARRIGTEFRLYEGVGERHYPHSLYLEVAAETGLIGLIIFGAAMLVCFVVLRRVAVRARNRGDPTLAGLSLGFQVALVGYLVAAVFLHGQFPRHLWLMFGFAMALDRVVEPAAPGARRRSPSGSTRSPSDLRAPPEAWPGADVRTAPDEPATPVVRESARPEPRATRRAVAVLLSRFPLITETFILREVEELERQGQPVLLVPLLRERPAVSHREATPWMRRALYTPFISPAILAANVRAFRRRPRLYARLVAAVLLGAARSPGVLLRTIALFPKSVHLAERLESEGIRHVHAHFATHPATAARIVRELTGITYSITAHAHDVFVRDPLLGWRLAGAEFVRVISRFNQRHLEARYAAETAGKLRVVHVGIDVEAYAAAGTSASERGAAHESGDRADGAADGPDGTAHPGSARSPLILCVAALKPYKGVPVLLEACRRLREQGLRVRCDVVGDGPMRARLERLVRRRRLDRFVRLPGARPQHEIAERLRGASVFALPSVIAADGQMEGIPVALMEAMAAGVPVVASSISGIPELVEHEQTGLLVPPGDADEVAAAIRRLIDDPALASSLAERAARKVADEFELGRCVARLRDALDAHNPPLPAELDRLIASVGLPGDGNGRRSNGREPRIGVRRVHEGRDSTVLELLVADGGEVRSLVLKAHRTRDGESMSAAERARREYLLLSRLDLNGGGRRPECRVPRPLLLDKPAAALLMEACRHEPLDDVIRRGRGALDPRRRAALLEALRAAGIWLEAFHRAVPVAGDPEEALADVFERAHRDLARCAGGALSMRDVGRVYARLARLRARVAAGALRVVGQHGDYWPGNVFVGEDVVEAIDLEGFRPGLAEEDVGYFVAHLSTLMAYPGLGERRRRAATAFLEGYAEAGTLDALALELCRTTAVLRLLADGARDGAADPTGPGERLRRLTLRRTALGGV